MRALIAAMALSIFLVGCGAPPEGARLQPQKWGDVIVEIESRPAPIRVGMNEFLILATEERGRPVRDLLISIRAADNMQWRQAIQDGHSGVYRRAVKVPGGASAISLHIKRKMSEDEVVLNFPIQLGG